MRCTSSVPTARLRVLIRHGPLHLPTSLGGPRACRGHGVLPGADQEVLAHIVQTVDLDVDGHALLHDEDGMPKRAPLGALSLGNGPTDAETHERSSLALRGASRVGRRK